MCTLSEAISVMRLPSLWEGWDLITESDLSGVCRVLSLFFQGNVEISAGRS